MATHSATLRATLCSPFFIYYDKENNREFRVYAKMERDYRDLGAFPETQNELKEFYETWKKLIKIYEKIDLN